MIDLSKVMQVINESRIHSPDPHLEMSTCLQEWPVALKPARERETSSKSEMLTGHPRSLLHRRTEAGPSNQVSFLGKLRTANSHLPRKVAAHISPAFWKGAGKPYQWFTPQQMLGNCTQVSCPLELGSYFPFLYPTIWRTGHSKLNNIPLLKNSSYTHAWAFHKKYVIYWKSAQVNKRKIKREVWSSHSQLFALENLNEYSLRANYKMLTLKCWVAGRIMGYCTVKMPDSCMLSCCVI